MRHLLLALALLAPAAELRADRQLAHRFVEALVADDMRAFAGLLPDVAAPGGDWKSITETLDRTQCIEVIAYEVPSSSDGAILIRMNVRARAAGISSQPMRLPSLWRLELIDTPDGPRIGSARTEERRIAIAMADARTDDERRALFLGARDVDPLALIFEFAEEAALPQRVQTAPAQLALARSLAQAYGDRATEARVIRMQSRAALYARDPKRSLELAREGLAVAQESGNADAIGEALQAAGTGAWMIGDATTALADYARAAAMLEQLSDPRHALRAMHMTAYIHATAHRPELAAKTNEEILARARHHGWHEGAANALINLANMHAYIANDDRALDLLRQAREEAERGRVGSALRMVVDNMATAEFEARRYERAIALIREGDRLDPTSARSLSSFRGGLLGRALLALGRLDEAERALRESEEYFACIDEQILLAATLVALSEVTYRTKRFEESAAYGHRAMVAHDSIGDTRLTAGTDRWLPRAVTARALRRLGRMGEAELLLRDAIDEAEATVPQLGTDAIGRSRFVEDNLLPYLELVQLLHQQGRSREALLAGQRIKARALREVTGAGESARDREAGQELESRLVALNREARAATDVRERAALAERVAAARLDLERFRDRLFMLDPVARAASPISATTLPRIAADAGTLIVDYVVADEAVIVFTIRGDEVRSQRIAIPRAELRKQVEQLRRRVEQRDLRYAEDARRLYDLLLRPIEGRFSAASLITFVPHAALWNVPFHVLIDRAGKHLVERVAVSYGPSLAMLARTAATAAARPPRSLLAFGNPTTAQLPEAEREVRQIAAFYPRPRILTGRAARESALKAEAGEYRVLHIATHARADDQSPLFSSMTFATGDDPGEDGLLEARELRDVALNADLVVLSACETARGPLHEGEGLIGLSWSFAAAGARTAVVSHWRTPSRATADLMITFHEHYARGTAAPVALRRAQLARMTDAQYAHPFHWGAFVVVGGGDTLFTER